MLWRITRYLLSIVTALALIALLCGCGKRSSLRTYQAVVANVASGKQAVSANGELILPANQSAYTVGGKAFATKRLSGPAMVLFPTWWGKGRNLRGYLYCAGPALAVGSTIPVNVPDYGPGSKQFVTTEVTVESIAAPSWYYVTRTMD